MCKLPCFEGEAYGRWSTGCPTCCYRSKQPGHTAHAGGFFLSKQALRKELLAARAALSAADRAERSSRIATRLLSFPPFRTARTVALHAALGAEADPSPLAATLIACGARLVYPRSSPGNRVLAFAEAAQGALVRGPQGALEPPPGAPEVQAAELDAIVLPGVAFSIDGHRLGRGGGYYDATLAAAPRALRVGLAFDVQLVPEVPREPHDVPLDAVVTETRLLVFPRESR
jgi:5-formyltetrahydrofolate cyclo-ligase